ncbi:MAG: hypothetical protein D6689_05945 [Deltaproteobacteria bacterium]|nr:MAG: hypothetical protein D6689_05945 [Deltaproteobacteria bacterium]
MLLVALAALAACNGFVTSHGGGDDDDDWGDPDPGGDGSDRTLLFYYGPMKLMYGESILYSIERITGHDFGSWDYTAPDPGSQAFVNTGNANGTFYPHCRLLGGCMEHRIPLGRTSFVGTAYVLELEKAVAEACYDRAAFAMFPGNAPPDASVQPIDIINHQYRAAFGAAPSTSDLEESIAYFESHLADPEFDDVSPIESAGRGHCRALLTTNRFLFY